MSHPDFDEFNRREKKCFPLCWRNLHPNNECDCKLILNLENEYLIHLKVACRSSEFFFNVAKGRFQQEATSTLTTSSSQDDDLLLKMQNGMITKIGQDTKTVSEFKEQVSKSLGFSAASRRSNSFFFARKHSVLILSWTKIGGT